MTRDGFDQGNDDLLLLIVGEVELQTRSQTFGVGDVGAQLEDAASRLETEAAGGTGSEWVGKAREDAGVTEVETVAGRDAVPEHEIEGEVDIEAWQPIKEGVYERHKCLRRASGSVREVYCMGGIGPTITSVEGR